MSNEGGLAALAAVLEGGLYKVLDGLILPLGGWGKEAYLGVLTAENTESGSISEPMLELMTVTLTVTFTSPSAAPSPYGLTRL
jgi:hypothetical protein